jgi:hypothetical protein
MATFVKHEACPRCGSRDNLGRYSDGSAFCFGCHYTERAGVAPWIGERNGQDEETDDGQRVVFPDDATSTLDERAVGWLSNYHITVPEGLQVGFRWSPFWEQLLMPVYCDGEVCCIQAKNFNPKRASKAKYYNVGDKSNHTTIYGTGECLVLTEDIVSSLKVGRTTASMPLLGTHIARNRLAALKQVYQRLVVWLDEDKWREARQIADAAKLLGFEAISILTPIDPKEYSDDAIRRFLGK